MDVKKRKRLNRKRKHEPDQESEFLVSQNKNRPFNKKAQAEEEELTRDLFGDSTGFLKSLEEVELYSEPSTSGGVDSGVGETETEGSSCDETKRRPVWFDEDDQGIDVGSALDSQGRKLPSGGINNRSNQYSDLLQHKFKSLVGTPKWANLEKGKTDDDSDDDELLRTSGHIVKSQSHFLKSKNLEFKKVKDLNIETGNEGPKITTVEFHPTCTVALVAGISGIASLLAVDGKRNNKLHSVAFQRFPIECGRFLNNGSEALLGSRHPHFFSYDLEAAKTVNVPLPRGMTHCKNFEISPNNIIAVAGKWGEVHLLSADSKELITTLKQNSNVTALAFDTDGSHLFGHSDTGEVTIWDIRTKRIKHKFTDEGCLQGTVLTVAPSGQLIAAASAQGVVNLYDMASVLKEKNPKPKKSVMNLTTSISSVRFNATSEILGFSSSDLANSVRLLHVASGTVFSNFPPFSTKLGRIHALSFSPNSGYAAFANVKSTVALYRLKHYSNY